jgi:hypothetical protein
MADKKTRARRRDGALFEGDDLGSSKPRGERHVVRGPDGLIFPGEEKGYVDRKGDVRHPDGTLFRGDVAAHTRGGAVRGPDGTLFDGEKWGYIDEKGNVRQRDGVLFKGRIIGHARGPNPDKALAHFVFRFDGLVRDIDRLERQEKQSPDHPALPDWADSFVEKARDYDALGDFDALFRRADELKRRVKARHDESIAEKKRIAKRAEKLQFSTDWKETGQEMKRLMAEWKASGRAPRERVDVLWDRFSSARQTFYDARTAHFAKLDAQREQALRKKRQIISRTKTVARSTDWKEAGLEMKRLMAEWKAAGSAPREHEDALWSEFQTARQSFYDRRSQFFDARDREQARNLAAKEEICRTAERLASASDPYDAADRYKALQSKWKSIGHVPRDRADALWSRFRAAGDAVFAARRNAQAAKQHAWRSKMTEALARKEEQRARLIESIAHDEGLIDGWRDKIYNLRPGGRAAEIRDALESKIESVGVKIRTKERRVSDLTDSIRDIRSKL